MKAATTRLFRFLLPVLFVAAPAFAQTSPMTPDIPPEFVAPTEGYDYTRREVMIPMRDGVGLYTVIVVPKGAHDAPILLTRTPYSADARTSRMASPRMLDILSQADEVFVRGGYIRVVQDVRGKYRSEGDYVAVRPLRGPLNDSDTDHSTDAYDTIEWLVRNVPESNGRVGMVGSSYDGFTAAMALVDPHPALKVTAPLSPVVDGWIGDDWFNHGAFRQVMFRYYTGQMTRRGKGVPIASAGYDDYSNLLRAGSAGAYARSIGLEQVPWWNKLTEHPAYDVFWQEQALDRILARTPLDVPTMWVQGLWDQEDMYGANHAYAAMEGRDGRNDRNYLVMGPWRHSQVKSEGRSLGVLEWNGDTALQFRRDILKPFFDQYLVAGAPKADTPPVLVYNTGEDRWDRLQAWPRSCAQGCASKPKPLYLRAGGALSFEAPKAGQARDDAYDEYVSDPAKPVPYLPRPVHFADHAAWTTWLVHDQRFVDGRPDVLTWMSEPLTEPLRIAGEPWVHLQASTSGSDSDWVVKLIDVYPDQVASKPEMGGYQLPVSLAIFRGRYRESLETPAPIEPGKVLAYEFALPNANHVFQPGHRVMVQVQSTLFPLYDRNPQTFVPNIFFAEPEDYRKATQRVWHTPQAASYLALPVP
ncbi:CocE/NonD family hydrolase [Luteimonas sp. 22616]|uniref:CocE/NonD family hydrolase n=1 Tax=Luteimonas sp. 22616 TaxID=3453951 RepID=UPI003F8326A5